MMALRPLKNVSRFLNGNTATNANAGRVKAKSLGLASGIGMGAFDFLGSVAGGDDVATAAAKATGSAILWSTMPQVMWAYTIATTVTPLALEVHRFNRQQKDWWNLQFMQGTVGNGFQDNQRALTMRQAAIEAIQGSKLNARSALGGEAKILHENLFRPSR